MAHQRKHTAWKKNRKWSEFHGGRTRRRMTHNVFRHLHDLQPPAPGQELPIFLVDNPSRDYYFPVSVEEIREALKKLPKEHVEGITHIWLCKLKPDDRHSTPWPEGMFIRGSGVQLIKLFAFPKSHRMPMGSQRPSSKLLRSYAPYCTDLRRDRSGWHLQWTPKGIKGYYLHRLLTHEIGHAIDPVDWSKANAKRAEDFAEGYAIQAYKHMDRSDEHG